MAGFRNSPLKCGPCSSSTGTTGGLVRWCILGNTQDLLNQKQNLHFTKTRISPTPRASSAWKVWEAWDPMFERGGDRMPLLQGFRCQGCDCSPGLHCRAEPLLGGRWGRRRMPCFPAQWLPREVRAHEDKIIACALLHTVVLLFYLSRQIL